MPVGEMRMLPRDEALRVSVFGVSLTFSFEKVRDVSKAREENRRIP
jgi:hypothetical protein